ncbi:MAG: DNA repair protein RecO [Planctomycetota bacterium]|nr:DNA repair protein RecO [Planctomycetota bacterium]
MPAHRCMGLVIRGADVFNTSRIFTLFTRDLGRVEGIAKGSRRLKSPFENGLDLLSICDIVILHKGNETLDLITEASLVERFGALRADLPAMYAGCYVAELLNDLTHLHDPHPKLFDAAVITLRNLSDDKLMWRRLMRFELALLRELGLMPSLELCVHCGNHLNPEKGQGPIAFGLSMGGVLCMGCRHGQPHVATLSETTLCLLRSLANPGRDWRELGDFRDVARAREVLSSVICHLMGRRPKLHRYLLSGSVG